MKHENIKGYPELRKKLEDARILQVRATTEEERAKADILVRNLRRQMSKILFDHNEERKVK